MAQELSKPKPTDIQPQPERSLPLVCYLGIDPEPKELDIPARTIPINPHLIIFYPFTGTTGDLFGGADFNDIKTNLTTWLGAQEISFSALKQPRPPAGFITLTPLTNLTKPDAVKPFFRPLPPGYQVALLGIPRQLDYLTEHYPHAKAGHIRRLNVDTDNLVILETIVKSLAQQTRALLEAHQAAALVVDLTRPRYPTPQQTARFNALNY